MLVFDFSFPFFLHLFIFKDDPDLRFLLAEGLVIEAAREPRQVLTDNGLVEIVCAAPILRAIILSTIQSPKIEIAPEDMPDCDRLDPRWLLTHTIEVGLTKFFGDGAMLTEMAKCLFFFFYTVPVSSAHLC